MPQTKEPKKVKTARLIFEDLPEREQTLERYGRILDALNVPRATKKRALQSWTLRKAGLEN